MALLEFRPKVAPTLIRIMLPPDIDFLRFLVPIAVACRTHPNLAIKIISLPRRTHKASGCADRIHLRNALPVCNWLRLLRVSFLSISWSAITLGMGKHARLF
jgi:hypothetical protein